MQTQIIPSTPRLGITAAGSGPLVIFIHGMGGDRSTWHKQIEALQHAFTAVSVDLRGYGDSGDPLEPLNFKRDFTNDLIAVMDYFGAPRAHLVGLSMGGRVARTAALRAPHRVASVTLANTSPGFDHLVPEQLDAFVAARSRTLESGDFPPDFGQQQASAMVGPNASLESIHTAATAMRRLRLRNYLEVLKASTLQDRGDKLEDITCPALIITSDHDPVYPDSITKQLQARIAGAHTACIRNAGHLSNLEQPEAFNKALLEFLCSLPSEASAIQPTGDNN